MGMRLFGIVSAAFMAIYGAIGVLRNNLNVSLSKSGAGVHLHGFLAWLCFVGMMMMIMVVMVMRLLQHFSSSTKFSLGMH